MYHITNSTVYENHSKTLKKKIKLSALFDPKFLTQTQSQQCLGKKFGVISGQEGAIIFPIFSLKVFL